jgi:hypothetical protein
MKPSHLAYWKVTWLVYASLSKDKNKLDIDKKALEN